MKAGLDVASRHCSLKRCVEADEEILPSLASSIEWWISCPSGTRGRLLAPLVRVLDSILVREFDPFDTYVVHSYVQPFSLTPNVQLRGH